jgi:predicted phage terminase large subunit-like protein
MATEPWLYAEARKDSQYALAGYVPDQDMVELDLKQICDIARFDFAAFARFVFPVLQPGVEFEPNWHIECIAEHLEAMERGELPRLIINLPPRSLKSYLVSQAFPAWVLGRTPSEKFINISYGASVVEQNAINCRRIINSPFYKICFPDLKMGILDRNIHFQTDQGGHYYADTALSTVTGIGCNYMVLDDLLKPMEALSDTIRNSTNENMRATLLNRFDDRRIGKLLMVMQRLHVDDPTGNLLKDKGITLLKLPGETKTRIHVSLKTPKRMMEWDMPENSLLFPVRLSREALDQLRMDMTEYHYCTPAETPILMADLSTKRISDVNAGDKVMGFTAGHWQYGAKLERRKLTPSTVQRITCRRADVIKITLDSGKTIRCTPDHKWFTGRGNRSRNEKHRKLYAAAKIGSQLSRVCDPFLPELKTENEFRMAGWLAGFFDGEGSAVVSKNRNGGCIVSFAQGADRNLPLCNKLEEALAYFGITFGYDERIRDDRKYKYAGSPLSRYYYLTGNSLENLRKLLHVIKVNKWRDRIAAGAYISRFIRGEERVLSIEPDGYEPVYSLTTETGNYIAWGLASSNCGQILQEPVPIGGGEFKDNWVKYYEGGAIRPASMNIAILCDPSGGEEINKKKRKTSDWTAFMVVGMAPDHNYYLLDIIRDRLNPTERIDMLFTLHRKWVALSGKVPKVGYEKYGMMTDTHYIKDKQKKEGYMFPLIELGGKMMKEERIRRLIPDMQQERWYFPANLIYVDNDGRRFDLVSELVNSEMATFPKGRFDDMLDGLSRIYDPEMSMIFPRLQPKIDQNIIRTGESQSASSWMDY